MEKKELKTWKDASPKQRRLYIFLFAVMALFVVIMVIPVDETNQPAKKVKPYKDLSNDVTAVANMVVSKQLKYPEEAKFEALPRVIRLDSITYEVQGYVVAKNGFGVKQRVGYIFSARFNGTREQSRDMDETLFNMSNWQVLQSDLVE